MTRILIAAALVLGGQSVLAQAPLLTPLDGARPAQPAARLAHDYHDDEPPVDHDDKIRLGRHPEPDGLVRRE